MKQEDVIKSLVLKIKQEDVLVKDEIYLLHAVLYTVNIDELVELFLSSNDNVLRKYLISNIEKRLGDKLVDKVILYNFLMDVMKEVGVSYKIYQRARMLMRFLYKYLPVDLKKEFYEYFINSKFLYDKDLAIFVSGSIWDSSLSQEYISLFLNNKDEAYLEKVLENGRPEDIVDDLKLIWQTLETHRYKSQIMDLLLPKYFDCFGFLKDCDPVGYLHVLAKSGEDFVCDVSDDWLECILNGLDKEKIIFGLWCVGRMGKWSVLEKYVSFYI